MFGFGGQPQQPIGETQRAEQSNQIPFYQTSEELGKEMINTSGFLDKVRLLLLGYVETEDGWKKIGEQLVNEKGAGAIINLLNSNVGKEVFLTKITDYDKVRIARDLWKIMIRAIIKNRIEWDMSVDSSKWKIVRCIVLNQTYYALCRGVEGTEKRFFGDVYQTKTIMANTSQQQYKKGWLG